MEARTAGRKGRPWRRLRAQILRASDICHLCGHPGATEVDHLIPRSQGGSSRDPNNLAPAHGAWGRCPVCKQACNQRKGAGRRVQAQGPPAPAYTRW